MTKEYAQLYNDNANFITDAADTASDKIKHLIFSTITQDDSILLPLCGITEDSSIASYKVRVVNCPECLVTAIRLAGIDSYSEALTYLSERSAAPPPAETQTIIIGLTKATYYYNLLALNLIHDGDGEVGEPNMDTIAKLHAQLADIVPRDDTNIPNPSDG